MSMTVLTSLQISHALPANFRKIYIGYSGGMDSHVLLHLCAADPALKPRITGVYINHGLQREAVAWGEHCRRQCLALNVDFMQIQVRAEAEPGESPEAVAREARYSAFINLLQTDDLLMFAQHREDQMETVLLQLFRGSGVHGLAAMPVSTRFGSGCLLRPLLNVGKNDILDYARRHALSWVDDPSNRCDDFDRNFLRNQIVPQLKLRWPSLDKTIARAAQNCNDAALQLDEWARTTLPDICDASDHGLSIDRLWPFNEIQRNFLLRYWLHVLGLKPPSRKVLRSITEELIAVKGDARAKVYTQGYWVRKYRHKLYCIADNYFIKADQILPWPTAAAEIQMPNGSSIIRILSSSGIDMELWRAQTVSIDYRRGGEKIKLPGREGRHCLKKLYQEAGIPPWQRDLRPLIYLNGRLAAVAGLWIDEWVWKQQQDACYQIVWQV